MRILVGRDEWSASVSITGSSRYREGKCERMYRRTVVVIVIDG